MSGDLRTAARMIQRLHAQPLPAALVLLLTLAAAASLPGRPGAAADESEVRRPILTYFAGVEARDPGLALSGWASKSPDLAGQRTGLAAQLKAYSEARVKNIRWGRTSEDASGIAVRVTFELETRRAAAADTMSTLQRRTFQLVSEMGAWRIWRNVVAERFLAEAWLKAGDPEARARLLDTEPELLSPTLVQQLRRVIGELDAGRPLEEQLAHYAAALALAERVGDPKEIARLVAARGGLYYQNKDYPRAAVELRRAVDLLQAAGEAQDAAVTQFNLGMTHVAREQFKDALPLFEASAAGAAAGGFKLRESQARYWVGYSRHSLLDHAGALPAYQASADLARAVKDGPGEARALRKVGDILKVLRRDVEAVPAWERSADLYRDAGMARAETEVLYDIGLTQGALGNYALAYLAQMRRLKSALALGDPRVQADSISNLALTLGVLGQTADEAKFLESELTLRQRIGDVPGEANAQRALGDAYRDLSRFGDAVERYTRALELARQAMDREKEGQTLAAQARLHGQLGDYRRAAEAGEQAVRLFRELKLPSREADAVRELGKQYRAQGRHPEALAQFDASLALNKQAGDALGAARDLDEAAQDHLLTGRYREALALYDSALKLYQAASLRLGEADIYNKQGATLKSLGRYTEAEAAYKRSFDLSDELGLETGKQQARANLAGLYTTTGRYPEALAGYTEALAAFRKLGARSAEATVLTNLGKLYAGKGELQRAEEQHRAALVIYRELKDARGAAQELHNLADVNAGRARFGEALAGFTEALKEFRAAGLRLDEANTLSEQANVYRQLGKTEEALALYEDARRIRADIGDRAGLARGEASVAAVHLRDGKHPEALKAYRGALATVRELGEKPSEPALLNNLGLVLRAMGRMGEARKCLEEALSASRALGERAGEAGALGNLALIQQLERKPAEAERTYREALKLGEENGLPDVTFRCWFGLGMLHREQKQWRIAARELGKATGLIERIRGDVREQSLQTSYLEQFVSPFHQQAECLLAAGEPAAAYLAGERAKARALVDVLRNGKVSVTKAMSPVERETEAKLDGRLTALNAEMREARFLPTDQLLERETQLTETREALEQFRRQLFLTHPGLQSQRGGFAPPTLTQLNHTLFAREPGLCVLTYLAGFSETIIFAISRGKSPTGPAALSVYRAPISRKLLEERVQAFWGECSQSGGQYKKPGQQLYRDLIQPAARDLEGKTRLVLVADGPLHILPFQALVDARGKHLVEQLALSYAPSVSALVAMEELGDRRRAEPREPGSIPILAFGRPKMDAGLSDLPATEAEVRAISRLFGPGAELATGADASEERFKSTASRARSLHLATHGLVNERAPMYSALALAHGPSEDGRLEARELLDLDLRADLVVLSACETALGKIVGGEGVRGLTWALFVAGAPSTVVSHWQVEDETTGVLMAAFYRRMLPPGAKPVPGKPPAAALSKAQALRSAQLGVMRDGKHAHPYFWAPFILVGDGRGSLGAMRLNPASSGR